MRSARLLPALLLVLAGLSSARADAPISFNRDIRPLLADRCFPCHGPDASHRKAGLRLDTSDGARAVVAGKPEQSELVQRISRKHGRGRMPPPRSGKSLAAGEIDLLRRWVAQGAPYEKHWSFVPPRRPVLPAVRDTAWPDNAIDRFILARI